MPLATAVHRRRSRRRTLRYARRPRRLDPHVERLCHRHAVDRQHLASHRVRTLQPDVDPESRPHSARRRRRLARRRSRVPAIQSRRGRDVQPVPRGQYLWRLQRGQPRGNVDRARLREPGRAVQAAERDGRRPAAQSGRHADTRGGRPRSVPRRVSWNAGVFRAGNHDDILFVTSEQTGFGYFRNFGETRRQGHRARRERSASDASRSAQATPISIATFESDETVNGESNSTNDAAADGEPGLEGTIEIAARRPDPVHSGTHAEGVRRCPGDVALLAGCESRRGVELVRARQREQPARTRRRRTISGLARHPATRS